MKSYFAEKLKAKEKSKKKNMRKKKTCYVESVY
jgi:hypothetical protein